MVVPVAVPATEHPAVVKAAAVDAKHAFAVAAIVNAFPSTGQVITHDFHPGAAD